MQNKQVAIFILISSLCLSQSTLAKDKEPIITKEIGVELVKEFGAYRPAERLILNREPKSPSNLELENDWFDVLYPTCFKVEPTIEDSDDVTIKNSASVTFDGREKCTLGKGDPKAVVVSYGYALETEIADRVGKVINKGPATAYAQTISINDLSGNISATIRTSNSETYLLWEINIPCRGKKNELFQIGFASPSNLNLREILKSKKFEIPAKIKTIVSSFRCKKTR